MMQKEYIIFTAIVLIVFIIWLIIRIRVSRFQDKCKLCGSKLKEAGFEGHNYRKVCINPECDFTIEYADSLGRI